MSNFYTSVTEKFDRIYFSGYKDGRRFRRVVNYKPYLFIKSKLEVGKYKTLGGDSVERKGFTTINEARNYVYTNKSPTEATECHSSSSATSIADLPKKPPAGSVEVPGANKKSETTLELFGGDFETAFIHDTYPGKIEFDFNLLSIVVIDIETDSRGGFGNIEKADKEVTAITLRKGGKSITFGCKEYKPNIDGERYVFCFDERQLLKDFLNAWGSEWSPDIVTGWNVEGFDVPYLVRRISNLLGKDFAEQLSPFGILEEKTITSYGKERVLYFPVGVQVLDYLKVYKKFSQKKLESYSLDHVCMTELGEGKLDYSEFKGLSDLYEKDYDKFISYNIKDTERVEALEKKLGMMQQLLTIAYLAKTNYQDVFGTIRVWDSLIYGFLLERGIVVPHQKKNVTDDFVGGYVKDVVPGRYGWVTSFDFTSLYPSLIMSFNISPETYVDKLEKRSIEEILDECFVKYHGALVDANVTITGNSCLYDRSRKGFLPSIMEMLFDERVTYKKRMKEKKKILQGLDKNDPGYAALKDEVQKLSNMEYALKILLNSGYGAVSNKYFRFFSLNNAEAITTSGQMAIRWVENAVNGYMNSVLKTKDVDYVIGVDTDSIYLHLGPLIEKLNLQDKPKDKILDAIDVFSKTKLKRVIKEACEELGAYTNIYQKKLSMKREVIADRGLWRAKKNYALNVLDEEGLRFLEPKMKIVGFEIVKSNTPKICRDALKKCLGIVMNGEREELINFLGKFKADYAEMSFADIASPTSVNGVSKYNGERAGEVGFLIDEGHSVVFEGGTPRHVKASLTYNEMLKTCNVSNKYQTIHDGEKIKYLSLKCPNPTRSDAIAIIDYLPEEFGLLSYIDYEAQFVKTFINPLKSFTDIVLWDIENKATIDGFFC
jgi:DNA polymerase elongation subunit (family B)